MNKSVYFIILDIGIIYEKGAWSSGLWKIGETELQKTCFKTDFATEQKVCSIMDELLDKALHENRNVNSFL